MPTPPLTNLMPTDSLHTYVVERLFSTTPPRAMMQQEAFSTLVIYNGFPEVEVLPFLTAGKITESYQPARSAEKLYFDANSGIIYFINSKDPIRKERTRDLVRAFNYLTDRDVKVEIIHRKNDENKAREYFRQQARKRVDQLFEELNIEVICNQKRLPIMMGPFSAIDQRGADISQRLEDRSDYLNFRVYDNKGIVVPAFDYVFAGQAENILLYLFERASVDLKGIPIQLFHYGKYGGVNPVEFGPGQRQLDLDTTIIPVAFIDEQELNLRPEKSHTYQLPNDLLDNKTFEIFNSMTRSVIIQGTTLNTVPVLQQQRESLELAQKLGVRFLDMECARMGAISLAVESRFPGIGPVSRYFSGCTSDLPLEGKTLGDVLPATSYIKGLRNIVNAYAEIIRRHK